MKLDLQIDIVEGISKSDFRKKYLLPQKPVVIRGLMYDQPAGKKWSLNWFKKTMGKQLIDVFDDSNPDNKKGMVTDPDFQMPFSEFIDIIKKDESTDCRMFLANLYKENKNLYNDFSCPDLMEGLLGNIGYTFFGGKDAEVKIHFDIDHSNVLLTHFEGRKRVVLIDPKYTELLYRLPFNLHTNIDIDKPDYDKYPALRYVHGYDVVLEAGDSLFMPSAYWHYITYLEGGFSVAFRKLAPNLAMQVGGLKNILLMMPFDKTMLKLFGNNWYNYKLQVANRRADRAVRRELHL